VFSLASNTKHFTAVSVGLVITNESANDSPHKLSWNTKIQEIFPEWKLTDPVASELTDVVDLLSGSDTQTSNG
jgi:hypothetical protein